MRPREKKKTGCWDQKDAAVINIRDLPRRTAYSVDIFTV